jgi:hypothetical protein
VGIYDLNNIQYLEHDIKNILNRIDQLYKVEFKKGKTLYYPKTFVDNKYHWTSYVCKDTFNKLIPEVKSLHKDMYAVLETIFKSKTGNFKKLELEKKYSYLKEFRLLNNKLKHYNDTDAEINLTELVIMEQYGHLIDIYCNFKYKDSFESLSFCDLIDTFLKIIEDEKVIIITRA